MADKEQPAGTIGRGRFQAFDGRQIQVVGWLIHDDQMGHIDNAEGKEDLPDLSGAGLRAFQQSMGP